MPTISMFYGIIIRMYFAPAEHPPPHFHVYYAEYKATVDIRSCEVLDGNLPKKQTKRNRLLPLLKQAKNRWAKPFVSEIIRSQEPSAPTPDSWVAGRLGICCSANTT